MPHIQPTDLDMRDTERGVMRLPKSWWATLDEMGRETKCDRSYLIVQLVRWSLDQPETAPIPEGPELRKNLKQDNVRFTRGRWSQIEEEAKRRGLSENKVLQAHLKRAMDDYALVRAAEPLDKKKR